MALEERLGFGSLDLSGSTIVRPYRHGKHTESAPVLFSGYLFGERDLHAAGPPPQEDGEIDARILAQPHLA